MQKKRKIIIGDVHGCLPELESLLDKLHYTQATDQLYFVGDLINKGPDSIGVLDLCIQLKAKSVLGNHELSLQYYWQRAIKRRKWVEDFTVILEKQLPEGKEYIQRMPKYIDEEFTLVHAGVVPNLKLAKTPPFYLTTIRTWDGKGKNLQSPLNPPWFDFYKKDKLIVFGHWAALNGLVRDNCIGLDTGCVYGKQLSALILPERKIVSVDAQETYKPILHQ